MTRHKKHHKTAETQDAGPIAAPPTQPGGRSLEERLAEGKALRQRVSRKSHAGWHPPAHRRDPIDILIESGEGRVPELLPIRYGRMLQSPFAFYRGAPAIMAADLAATPVTGIRAQLCGDCHLLNFGVFATPERRLLFDINDFDETLPGPWEWDIKRLAASFIIGGRHNGFSEAEAREAVLACALGYRERMAEFASMQVLDVWYASIEVDTLLAMLEDEEARQRIKKRIAKAAKREVADDDFPKLAALEGGAPRIRDNPPLIYHPRQSGSAEFEERVREAFGLYRESLSADRRLLLDRYELKDIAFKVVGVGSVGTRCGILLMMAGSDDPLFLQVKEARPSVLEPHLGRSPYANHGQRVVVGQRLMQSASDLFLGWTEGREGRHFYVRQLRDMKIKPQIEIYTPEWMRLYAEVCGWCLARAHARSGDAARISGYLGKSERFDEALADFAQDYADQNERDHQALVAAVRAGRIEVYLEQ